MLGKLGVIRMPGQTLYLEGSLWDTKKEMYGKDANGNPVYVKRRTPVQIVKNYGKNKHNDTILDLQTMGGILIKKKTMKVLRRHLH